MLLRVLVLDGATIPATPNIGSQSGTATHSVSLTPAVTGSLAFAAEVNMPAAAAAPVAATGNTVLDALSDTVSDSTQPYGFGSFQSSATLTAGTAFTAGSTDSAAGGVAVLEVDPAGTISTDVSSPVSVSSVSLDSPVTSVTTAAFAPPPGTVLVALVAAAGSPYGQATMTVTDSYGLTWTEAVRANSTGNGYAGIWYAQAPAVMSSPAVTLPQANVGFAYSATVTAAGGYPAYTYNLATGTLPAGLSLSPYGQLSGTPTGAGTSTFTVTITDSFGNTATSGTLTLTVTGTPPATPYVAASWQQAADPYVYGTTTVDVDTADHDWVLVVASWGNSEDAGAVCFVSDSARNVYRPVGLSNGGGACVQAWIASNAMPASKVYVSQSAFVRNLLVTVMDVRNMTAGFVVDVTVPPVSSNPAGDSWVMSADTTGPDLVVTAGTCLTGQVALPAAWSPVSIPAANGGSSQVVGWQYAPNAMTGLQAVFTMSSPHSYAGLMVAFNATAAPVISGSNPAWPDMRLEAAFGYQPGDPNNVPVWTDITPRFLGLSGQRGRSFELDELSAADLEVELDNHDGALTPFNTGSPYYPNVTLVTPLRLLADWQGRRYVIVSGLITALPQTFDFQRGIIKAALSDDYSKLPQVLLPSCMISEVLYDQPLHFWPLNDAQGAAQASNWSGRSTVSLVPVNSKYGAGTAGNTPATGFGNSVAVNGDLGFPYNLNGTTDTAYGNYASVVSTKFLSGTSLVDRDDMSLPLTSTGATYECWGLFWVSTPSTVTLFTLSDEKGPSGGGLFFEVTISKTGVTVTQEGHSWVGKVTTEDAGNLIDDHWHHFVLTVAESGTVTLWVDSVQLMSFHGNFPSGAVPNKFTVVGDPDDPLASGYFTGLVANVAVYDRVVDAERIRDHYVSGASGFNAELSGARIERVLSYARWAAAQAIEPGLSHQQLFNYLGGGYASSGLSGSIGQYNTTGGGFTDQGAQADITIQDVAAGELGLLFVAADGTLTFRQRDNTFNRPVVATVGDMDYALNRTSSFNSGLGEWLSAGTTNVVLSESPAWSYAGGVSGLLTVTSPGVEFSYIRNGQRVAVTAGASAWVMSPQGCYAQMSIDYYQAGGVYLSSATGVAAWCPPGVPVHLTLAPVTPPDGVVSMTFGPTIQGKPAAGTQLFFDRPRLTPGGFQIPYDGNVEITTDIQYLFNDIAVTRNVDQSTYRAKDAGSRAQFFPRVFTRTLYTSMNDPQAVVDCAQWLLGDYSQPQLRVTRLSVDAVADPELWPFVLGTDIGDLVFFERNPVGGSPVSGTFMVIGIQPDIGENKASFGYALAPVPGPVLTLGDPVYGVVGLNGLGW